MVFDEKPWTLDRLVRLVIGVGLAYGFIVLLARLSDVLLPFAAGILIAYLMNPLVERIQRRLHSRFFSVLTSMILVFGLLFALGKILIPLVIRQATDMGRTLARLGTQEVAAHATRALPPDLWEQIKDFLTGEEVQALFQAENFWPTVRNFLEETLPGVLGVLTGTANIAVGLLGLAIVMLYVFFLLLDYERYREAWPTIIPERYRGGLIEFVNEFNEGMKRYFRGQAMVAGTVGILFAVGFFLIDLPMGIPLGLFVGLLNMVPYLQILGFFPALLLAVIHALETGGSILAMTGLTLLVFAVVQGIQDSFLVPRIMGRVTGLSPAIILLSLSIWGKLLGLLGLLIALPMTCLLIAYYRRFVAPDALQGLAIQDTRRTPPQRKLKRRDKRKPDNR